jgi:electron transfer flavoprotein alpha subunit
MKTLVVVEHDNSSIKQSSLSTITAASKIGEDVEALIMGKEISGALSELKNVIF